METWCLLASRAPGLCCCMSGQLQGSLDVSEQLQESIQKICNHNIDGFCFFHFLKPSIENNKINGLTFMKFDTNCIIPQFQKITLCSWGPA